MIFHAVVLICNISVPACQTVALPMTFSEAAQCIQAVQGFEHGVFIGSPEGALIKRSECFNEDQYNEFVKTNSVTVLPLPEQKPNSDSTPSVPQKPVLPDQPAKKAEPDDSLRL